MVVSFHYEDQEGCAVSEILPELCYGQLDLFQASTWFWQQPTSYEVRKDEPGPGTRSGSITATGLENDRKQQKHGLKMIKMA